MKILHLNFVYPAGSTGKLVYSLHQYAINNGHESYVLYGRNEAAGLPMSYKFCKEWESYLHSAVLKLGFSLDYGGTPVPTFRAISFIRKYQPDIVHLHCLNGSCINLYRLLSFLAKERIKTVITHHAEFYYTANCPHTYDCMQFTETPGCMSCKTPGFSKTNKSSTAKKSWQLLNETYKLFDQHDLYNVAVSPWVESRGRMSSLLGNNNFITILNGLDTGIFHRVENRSLFKQYGCSISKKIILHVAAHFTIDPKDNKGGHYVLTLARRNPDMEFFIVAQRIGNIEKCELPANMHIIGRAKDQNELAQLYSSADLTIITSKRETFSMICAESLACGTPVIGFKAGGPESIAIPRYSRFVDYSDLDKLHSALSEMINMNFDREEIEILGKEKYSGIKMNTQYFDLYNKILRS